MHHLLHWLTAATAPCRKYRTNLERIGMIGRAKRAPHWACSIEISRDWASEASPTLGCSIAISRDICIRYTISKCGLCAHIITLEFSVIPEAKSRDNRKRESYSERITHTLI